MQVMLERPRPVVRPTAVPIPEKPKPLPAVDVLKLLESRRNPSGE